MHNQPTINMFRNFILAGGRGKNPAQLSMTLEPMKLEDQMGIAVKSIAYGTMENVYGSNNTIYVGFDLRLMANDFTKGFYSGPIFGGKHKVEIPNGHYVTREQVVEAIESSLTKYFKERNFPLSPVTIEKSGDSLRLKPSLYMHFEQSPLLDFIKAEKKANGTWKVTNGYIPNPEIMGFLYLNIVQNSFINGRKSRVLCVCPFNYKEGYSFFEYNTPTYVPIEVRQFSDISLSILDLNGNFIPFSSEYDTLITLEMRPLHYK